MRGFSGLTFFFGKKMKIFFGSGRGTPSGRSREPTIVTIATIVEIFDLKNRKIQIFDMKNSNFQNSLLNLVKHHMLDVCANFYQKPSSHR